ncbi:MAG: thiol-disulfide oxidoreductase [Bacteroidetes bacterium RIFCSPLOWO2_12_FULL_35_15]|nr:MAG: thiol-disulfide oxidoreductase [Bacteroidetes bacterium RIFCSPLOWO2_12_FULL_35_15]
MGANNRNNSIVLFDGECNFCNSSVNFIIRHDKKDQFRFAALQSEIGKIWIKKVDIDDAIDSIILIEKDKIYLRSTAVLRISKRLSFPYPLLYAFIFIPSFLRDLLYDLISKNRRKWFRKKETCLIMSEEKKAKFIL